jgi:Skp family chaperone for outer membrane proteins
MKSILPLLIITTFLSCSNREKTGYININEVYNEINITKKYNQHLSALENALAQKISSKRAENSAKKKVILELLSPAQDQLKEVFHLTNEQNSIEEFYSKAFKDSSDKYNLMVKKTVNDLVYKYGEVNKFTYLFSPATSNSFMYADSTLDVTEYVIEYINTESK